MKPGDRGALAGLPALSVRRPVLALVLNLLIGLAGIAAFYAVEVRELPDVDRPIVSVRANYPGASPETMDAEVTSLVEGAVARVSGIRAIRSSSEENNFRMRAEFAPDVDLDDAAADVREAVSRVQRQLPDGVEQLTVVKADADARPTLIVAAVSDVLGEEELTRVIERDIVPELIAIDGVADVPLFGDRQRLLRVVVDPLRMTSYGLAVTDVAAVLREVPFDVPTGSFRSDDQELLVRADASVISPAQVEAVIIRGSTRIGDVAQVFYGPEDADSYVRLDGRPVIGLGIVRKAHSNAIRISDAVDRALARLNRQYDTLELIKTSDDATFIRGSVREVVITLSITVAIVVCTIGLFMGTLRTTLIPSVSIPVALVGTVAAIWLLGFSINILTLLALVLACGLIVDDAVVVIENVQRRRGQGLGPRAAAVLGTRQVFFAVIATTAVLVSVFVPIAFLPSEAGRLFREFGFVLSVAVMISSFVALSLVPALAARIPDPRGRDHPVRRRIERFGAWLADGYAKGLDAVLAYPWLTLVAAVGIAGGAAATYPLLDQELLPDEDRGVLYVDATGPDGVGLPYSERQAQRIEALLAPLVDRGEIESLYTIVGRYDLNRVRVVAPLVPWDRRTRSQHEIMAELRGPLADIPGAQVRVSSPNSLSLRDAGDEIEIALLGNDYDVLYEETKRFARAIEDRLENVTRPRISYQPTQPQLSVRIDRRRAADLGIPLDGLATTLRAMIDGEELVDLNVADQAVPILIEAATDEINDPGDLVNLHVATTNGHLVPLSSVVSLEERGVAAELDRHAQRRAIEIDSELGEGYPLQSAIDDVRGLADELLPPQVSMILLGEAEALAETSREVMLTYAIAFAVVFLVLCAQFEGLMSALVITLIVPFGIAAALLSLYLTDTSLNIYSQIGLIMLIGLMAKNGILLVEFADQLRDEGAGIREAITTSARVRLRPVVMTMLSTVLGSLPLILGSGPGAEARSAIGWVVFGGLGLAALFTLFLTPVFYLGLARFASARAAEGERLAREVEHAEELPDRPMA
ncbi:MAG: efflux RND transporter permease subunit [Gammaproteobacteria bacterium]|nr:efflux RND transporter permease subunit [Gammaproteobacteria bacterium]